MTNKNSIIKFRTLTDIKETSDKLASQFNLPKEQTAEAIFFLGLQQLQSALMQGCPVVVIHDITSSCKRIQVQKKNKKNTSDL